MDNYNVKEISLILCLKTKTLVTERRLILLPVPVSCKNVYRKDPQESKHCIELAVII